MHPLVWFAILVTLLATITDLRARLIPNWLTLSTAVIGLVANTYLHGPRALIVALLMAAFAAAIFVPVYRMGGIGGGDVKLAIALGCVYADFDTMARFLLFTTVSAAIFALVLAYRRGALKQSFKRLFSRRAREQTAPITIAYAPAFMFGAVAIAVIPLLLR